MKYIKSSTLDCPLCSKKGVSIFEIPRYPITEQYLSEGQDGSGMLSELDQEIVACSSCNHVYLKNIISKDYLYKKENYNTKSNTSIGSLVALDNFRSFILDAIDAEIKYKTIIDVGANDASLLSSFDFKSYKLIGIDPNINDRDNITCINKYIEDVNIDDYVDKADSKIIISSHTIEHIESPVDFVRQIAKVMNENDLFVVQFPSLEKIYELRRFDQIHHQHLHYFTLQSIEKICLMNGLVLQSYRFDEDHYGALMCAFAKNNKKNKLVLETKVDISLIKSRYEKFKNHMNCMDENISELNGNFYCYGASLMYPILPYYIKSLNDCICIIDEADYKNGLVYNNINSIIRTPPDISYENSNFVITALATKFAQRKIMEKLINRKVKNLINILNFN